MNMRDAEKKHNFIGNRHQLQQKRKQQKPRQPTTEAQPKATHRTEQTKNRKPKREQGLHSHCRHQRRQRMDIHGTQQRKRQGRGEAGEKEHARSDQNKNRMNKRTKKKETSQKKQPAGRRKSTRNTGYHTERERINTKKNGKEPNTFRNAKQISRWDKDSAPSTSPAPIRTR